MEEIDGLKFLYDKGIAVHVNGKTIDYLTGAQEGFTVTAADCGAGDCGGCCS